MRNLFSAALCLTLLLVSYAAPAAEPVLKVNEMAVTTKIVRGNPIDAVRRISSSSVRALYCFTRIGATTDSETSIKHVWYQNDEEVGDSELPVKGKQWRTYSKRVIDRESTGEWRVEARDNAGTLLKTVSFRIN